MYSGRAVKLLGEHALGLFASVLDNHSRRSLAKQLTRYAEETRSTVSFQLSPRLGRGRPEDDYWKAELFGEHPVSDRVGEIHAVLVNGIL